MMLPNGWKKVRLSELGTFSKGNGIKRDDANSGSIPAIRYGEIYTTHNDYIKEFCSFISGKVAKEATLLKKGDLLFSCSGETKEDIGKCVAFVSDETAYAGGDIIILSPTVSCDSKYIGYLCNASSVNQQRYRFAQGDSVVHISAESIGKIEIPFPPLKEQKKIAETLSVWDKAIEKTEKLIEAKETQKKILAKKLLDKNISPSKIKLDNVTINKEKWEKKQLGEILEFKNGVNVDKEKYGKGVKMISVLDILSNKPLMYDEIRNSVDLTKDELNTYSVHYGDILFQRSSENYEDAGSSNVYIDKEQIATYSGFVIRGKKKYEYNPLCLNAILKLSSVRNQITKGAAGAQHINVGQDSLAKVQVCLPSLQEQNVIADILSNAEKEISILKQQLKNYKKQKQGLMQKLLTGQWRV